MTAPQKTPELPAEVAGQSLRAVSGSDVRDWPEDASLENGNYQNACYRCGMLFIGHKRRVTCRVCADEWKAKWDAMTDYERSLHSEKRLAEVSAWVASRQNVRISNDAP